MKELSLDEIKEIQLDILKKVHLFCEENNLKYSLAYGTLLGAIRHKGFIPWDDDIDIMMLREDYDLFIDNFNETFEYLKVHSPEKDLEYPYPFAKVSDERTLLIENISYKYKMGVNIDVFPMDDIDIKDKFTLKVQIVLGTLRDIKLVKFKLNRNPFKNIILLICKLLLFPIPCRKIINEMVKNSKKYYNKKLDYCCNISLGQKTTKPVPKKWFEELINHEFEGYSFLITKYYEQLLELLYGDYMKLPPKEQQKTHHKFKAYKL